VLWLGRNQLLISLNCNHWCQRAEITRSNLFLRHQLAPEESTLQPLQPLCDAGSNQRYGYYCTTTTTILWPFFRDNPGEPVPEENFWTLWCKERFTEADTPTIRPGATPSGLTSAHLHRPPIFFYVMATNVLLLVCVSNVHSVCLFVDEVPQCKSCRCLPSVKGSLSWLIVYHMMLVCPL